MSKLVLFGGGTASITYLVLHPILTAILAAIGALVYICLIIKCAREYEEIMDSYD